MGGDEPQDGDSHARRRASECCPSQVKAMAGIEQFMRPAAAPCVVYLSALGMYLPLAPASAIFGNICTIAGRIAHYKIHNLHCLQIELVMDSISFVFSLHSH